MEAHQRDVSMATSSSSMISAGVHAGGRDDLGDSRRVRLRLCYGGTFVEVSREDRSGMVGRVASSRRGLGESKTRKTSARSGGEGGARRTRARFALDVFFFFAHRDPSRHTPNNTLDTPIQKHAPHANSPLRAAASAT